MRFKRGKYIVGIDEVGRGALAGPVVVVAVATAKFKVQKSKIKINLRDSKKLTPTQRETWCAYLKAHPQISYAIARVYPRTIDRINISNAANRAALRAYCRLLETCNMRHGAWKVYLDGGLYLGSRRRQAADGVGETLVKGDEKIKAVAAASIIAKVSRDRFMRRLARRYPEYGFDAHVGYGTKAHIAAIRKYGKSGVHRLTFVTRINRI